MLSAAWHSQSNALRRFRLTLNPAHTG
jgi:hypothetical protein